MVSATKACLPTITDPSAALLLSTSSKHLNSTLADLRAITGQAKDIAGAEVIIDAALRDIAALQEALQNALESAAKDTLKPLPDEKVI